MIAPWVLHRHRKLWRDPDAFDPSRFLPDAPPPPRFAYLPFGAGPRVCVGAQFALAEATLVLAQLMRAFHIAREDAAPVLPVAIVTTQPDHAPMFRLRPRARRDRGLNANRQAAHTRHPRPEGPTCPTTTRSTTSAASTTSSPKSAATSTPTRNSAWRNTAPRNCVAKKLAEWGIEVHRGVGGTGVVGVLRNGDGPQAIGLRADMDALPIEEETNLPYSSRNPGRMHACGHDGHTTMLLGAARYLAETRNFNGTVQFHLPARRGRHRRRARDAEGRVVRTLPLRRDLRHAQPAGHAGRPVRHRPRRRRWPAARSSTSPSPARARTARGRRRASIPRWSPATSAPRCNRSSRATCPPQDNAVLSVTRMLAGERLNVIPQTATLGGTVRAMRRETMTMVEASMQPRRQRHRRGASAPTRQLDFRTDLRAAGQPRRPHRGDRRRRGRHWWARRMSTATSRRPWRRRISASCWRRCPAPTSTSATARTARRCTTRTTISTTRRSPMAQRYSQD